MKKFYMVFSALFLGAGLILGELPDLYAQEAATEEFTLEEITVTAQKRAENQQKVAIAMDVISGDQMKEMGQTDINQILGNLSSATINKTGSALRIAIRGVSDDLAENSVQVTTPTAALNTDGVMTNRNQAGTGLYDVERVEVLVGPQSTLYASASPGGIVNVVTSSPKLDKFEGSAILEYGSYNLKHGEGGVNVPVSDTVALRVAASVNSRNGYNSNGGDDQEQKSARLKALFKPNDKLFFVVTGELSKQTDHGFASVKEFNNQDDKYYPDGTKLTDPWTSGDSTLGQSMKKTEKKLYGKMDWDLGPATLTITPAYTTSSSPSDSAGIDGRSNLYTTSVSNRDSYEKSIELRLASSEDFFFKWIVGAVYYKASDESISNSLTITGVANFNNLSNEDTVKALYANITYPVTDRFRATAGLRLARDFNHTVQNQSDGPPDLIMPMTVDQPYDTPSYKVGVEYDVNETSMLYGDISTAYRTQGMGFDAEGNVFPAEELTAFNMGSKNRFLGKRLQVNAAAYYYKYKNTLGINSATYLFYRDKNNNDVYDAGDEIGASPDSNAKAVGDYTQYGLDLDTSAVITDKDKVDLAISYMHGVYTNLFFDYIDATNHPETWLPGAVGTPDLSYDDKPKTNAPAWSITGSYSHNFSLWNGGILTARLDGRFKSSYILTFSEEYMSYDLTTSPPGHTLSDLREVRKQEAYYTADFTTTYAHPNGKWTLTGYVKNMTNYAIKTSWVSMGQGGMMMINPPRTYGSILSVKF